MWKIGTVVVVVVVISSAARRPWSPPQEIIGPTDGRTDEGRVDARSCSQTLSRRPTSRTRRRRQSVERRSQSDVVAATSRDTTRRQILRLYFSDDDRPRAVYSLPTAARLARGLKSSHQRSQRPLDVAAADVRTRTPDRHSSSPRQPATADRPA